MTRQLMLQRWFENEIHESLKIISLKISFPAFTICENSLSSYSESTLDAVWLGNSYFPIFVMLTELGLCRVVNFGLEEHFFHDQVDSKRIYKHYEIRDNEWLQNRTLPLKTPSLELGIDVYIENDDFYTFYKTRGNSSYQLIIHSPFELPTKENQKFIVADMDYDTFWITPQLNTIEDSMIGMQPQELEIKLMIF